MRIYLLIADALQLQDAEAAPVVPDALLHHWGEVYLANPVIRARGILFETFLRHPREILQAIAFEQLPLPVGLSPRQAAARSRIAACQRPLPMPYPDTVVTLDVHSRGDRYIEPLHHHVRPKRSVRAQFTPLENR